MRRDLLRTAARMYYLEDQSQQQIADQLGVSRSTVSRLLTDARRSGVVTITVEPPTIPAELGTELARSLGLRDAYVVPSAVGQSQPWADLAAGLGQALDAIDLDAGDVLLTSWGRTIWEVAAHPVRLLPGLMVAPMMAAADEPQPWFETNTVTRRVASALGATPRLLHAPVHPTPALRAELLRHQETRRTLRLWDVAKAAIVNIGAPPMVQPDYGPAHHARRRDELSKAVGDVASRYFDLEGQPVPYEDEERLLGISREQVQAIPQRIGIAVGQHKAPAIVGASRARLIDIVVTDAQTAKAVLTRLASMSQGAPEAVEAAATAGEVVAADGLVVRDLSAATSGRAAPHPASDEVGE